MSILVTGGAGFLGSHLCERLIAKGAEVLCFDNLSTGRLANISHLLRCANFAFVHGDVRDLIPRGDFHQIFNLACPASPPQYQADPVGTMMTSVVGVRNVLEASLQSGATVLQASTSEVYGDPEVHPQLETYRGSVSTIGPRACYDEGKRAAETLCFDYYRTKGVPIKVPRIFNTYGPRMDAADGRVVSNFVVRALRNEPMEIYGDGLQTRSFCYRDDLVQALIDLMNTDKGVIGPMNLGNPSEFTILELARAVISLTNSNSKLIFRDLPIDDPRQRKPDIELAIRVLGWRPTVSLEEGLKKTIAHFIDILSLEA